MKKLFISVPMKGRTAEEIKKSIDKMKRIAEAVKGEELEIITSFDEEGFKHGVKEGVNKSVWFLGNSIRKLAEADVMIGITDSYDWNGCGIEMQVARNYGIETIDVPSRYIMDDYDAVMEARWNTPCNIPVSVPVSKG